MEEHRKEGGSLLFRESMTMLVCGGMVTVLSPVTLSVEVHWEDVSELSVTVTQHKKNMLKLLNWIKQHRTPLKAKGVLGKFGQFAGSYLVRQGFVCVFLKLLCER